MKLIETGWQAPGFTRVTYHSTEGRKFWEPHIRRASNTVAPSEMESVATGLRECGTIHIPNLNADHVYANLAQRGLFWKKLVKVGKSDGFSHRRHPTVEDGDPNFTWFSVMGSSQEAVDDFELAHGKSNHDAMGKLLGFPACCRRSFSKNWPKYVDPMWQAAENTPGAVLSPPTGNMPTHRLRVTGHPGSNAMLRYIGARTTFHLPCSLQCEKSIANSEAWMAMISKTDPKAATSLKYLLSLPLAWDLCHGWVKVITPSFTVHAGSCESAERYIVEYKADPCGLADGEVPGAANGLVWPLRQGDHNNAPLIAAGGLDT